MGSGACRACRRIVSRSSKCTSEPLKSRIASRVPLCMALRLTSLFPTVSYHFIRTLFYYGLLSAGLPYHLPVCFICSLIPHASASCYWPNGEPAIARTTSMICMLTDAGTDRNAGLPSNIYSACDPSASASMCCALDRTFPFLNVRSGITCRSDGLCADVNNEYLSRTDCTDET